MNKKWLLILCMSLLCLLVACSPNTTETAAVEDVEVSKTEAEEVAAEAATETKDDSPIYIGQTWVTGSLNPVEGSTPWSLTSHGLTEYVYMLDEEGTLKSRFIQSLKQEDDLTWTGEMKQDVKFYDGSVVDSKAFCESMNRVMTENQLSNATAGKITFDATGEFSFTLKTERPTHAMASVFAEWTNVVFKEVDGTFVYTGPYMVKEFNSGTALTLVPNPHYPDADKRSEIVIKAFKDIGAMKLAIESGEIDMAFTLNHQVAKMLKENDVPVKTINAGYQYFAPVNLKGVLSDKAIRTAINYGLDRQVFKTVLEGGNLPTGLFAHYYSFSGENQSVYDKEKAASILEEAGWTLENGMRVKDGQPLKIKLVTYSYRPDLPVIMQLMVTQLQEIGISCETEIVENIDGTLGEGKFDIALYAQHSAPTGNPTYFLNQFFRTDGSKNHMGYTSTQVDQLLDEMGYLPLGQEMDTKAKEVQNIIFEDLPVLYLLDPEWHIGVSDRLIDYKPYGGDYYIVNNQLMTK